MGNEKSFPYLHGFSKKEQDRLRKQARFGEFIVYQDLDLSDCKQLLEVGCGVGAQSEILMRRFPEIQLTGIDLNEQQIASAQEYLAKKPEFKDRYKIQKVNASNMEFESNSFDGVFICWMLEHVPQPERILTEVRRVCKPGAKVYITEVMNHSFFLEPYSPNLWKYWMAFNDYQHDQAGDPFIGAKLGNLLSSTGFQRVETNIKTWHLDNRSPDKRKQIIEFWNELLLSGAPQLIKANVVAEELVKNAEQEFLNVRNDPNAVFFYSFMQAKARVLNH